MTLDNSNQLNLDITKSVRLIKCFRNYSTQRLDAFTLPKPRGKSPGWEKGQVRTKRTRYPVVKKRKSSDKKGKNRKT